MKNFYLLTLTICLSTLQLSAQNNQRILLHSGAVNTTANLQSFLNEATPMPNEVVAGYYYRLIQFNSIPTSSQRQTIAATGLKLLAYIPNKTYLAAIPLTWDKNQSAQMNIYCVIKQQPVQKINSNLLGSFPEYAVVEKGKVDVIIQYQKNITSEAALKLAANQGKIINANKTNYTIALRIASADVFKLAEQAWVFYMDAATPPSTPDDTKGKSLHRSNYINSDYATGFHYDGTGVVVGLADDGEIGPHIDFTGRFTDHVGTGPGGGHGDMTCGIMVGAGNLDPTIRGMASGAFLHVYDINGYPHIIDAVSNYTTLSTVISSTSYSQGCNAYTSDTEFGDQTIHDNPQLLFVFSAGNNGAGVCTYGAGAGWGNITGGYKQGKNVIACGNLSPLEVLDPSSSRGPASDGRIKPDICANGLDQRSTDKDNTYQIGGGTSAASPGVAGIVAQLYQAYKELNGGLNPESPLIKACMLNSAEDIGNPGPDFTYGWGRVNARRALTTLIDNRYLLDSVDQGITKSHIINVPANVRQLRAMLYWLDPAGSLGSSQFLVNDLNMQITDPLSAVFNPWKLDPTPLVASLTANAIRGVDSLNNMEQVTIDNPVAGNYTVTVNGNAIPVGAQRYYIVYEFRTDEITVTYPNGGEGVVPGQQEVIRWDAPKGVSSFTLQYSIDNGGAWTNIATANSAAQQYTWTVPTSVTGDALIRVSNAAGSDVSDTVFSIIGTPQNISVDWACVDSIHLIWNNVSGATGYEIYRLGAKYMDPIGTSATNSFTAYGINPLDTYWFSVSAITSNGTKGRRANAIEKQPGLFNCQLAIDAQISSITNPLAGSLQSCQNNNLIVFAVLQNNSINSISNVPVSYQLDGGAIINEVYTGTLLPSGNVTYVFLAPVNISAIGNHTLKVWSSIAGDQNAYNDTITAQYTVLNGVNAVVPFTENFDSFNLCSIAIDCGITICPVANGWINEENNAADDIDFRTNAGATASTNTGPTVDHTTGSNSGQYLYLEASGTCNFQTALLTTPCIDLSSLSTPTLTFWYHMYGTDMGELHVDVYKQGIWALDVMAPISGDQGNNWLPMSVPLGSFAGEIINVRFRGITGSGFASDLAIDDINIDNAASINENEFAGDVMIYPNPSSGIFNMIINNMKSQAINMEVYTAEGKLVVEKSIPESSRTETTIDMSDFAKGIYVLELKSASGAKRIKLTVL